MNSINLYTLYNQSNLALTFQHPTKPKTYLSHPIIHLNKDDWRSIGKGMSGDVMKAKFLIVKKDGSTKTKKFAVKLFLTLQSKSLDEFECHTKILTRIEHCREQLKALNINPGNGIEKKPVYAFFDPISHHKHKNYLVKQLYNEDLKQAIRKGLFEDHCLLHLAFIQMFEGLITLMTIGALYFDIKPANILVGRKDKFEVAFSDFEKISFLKFNAEDDGIVKKAIIYTPLGLAHDQELLNLNEIQKKAKPAQEFIPKLHQLYVFMLGAHFFEMVTKLGLKKFIIARDIFYFLEKNGLNSDCINETIDKGIEEKDLKNVIQNVNAECVKHGIPLYNLCSAVDKIKEKKFQNDLITQMSNSGVPTFYIDLILLMINPEAKSRINIHNAFNMLKTYENTSNSSENRIN